MHLYAGGCTRELAQHWGFKGITCARRSTALSARGCVATMLAMSPHHVWRATQLVLPAAKLVFSSAPMLPQGSAQLAYVVGDNTYVYTGGRHLRTDALMWQLWRW